VDNAKRNDEDSPGSLGVDVLALLRRPAVVGAASAVAGLLVGMVIGRASVDREPLAPAKAPHAEGRSTTNESQEDEEEAAPEGPTPSYRLYFGRPLPKSARGFERVRGGARPVSRLLGKEASVQFEIDPKAGEYVVTVVASFEEAKKGTLQLQFDRQALTPIALGKGWQIYSSPIPAELVTKETHTLALRVEGAGENPLISIDSLAVAPVGSEVNLEMGAPAVGTLIEGFGKPAATYVWNQGERSTLGVVLAPVAADYRLTVKASTLPQLDPLTVTGKINGTSVGTAVFEKQATEANWSVPASALRAGLNRIEFTYPKTIKPSDLKPNSKDDRPLAVRFKTIELKPAN
jgi:hypothetical protein